MVGKERKLVQGPGPKSYVWLSVLHITDPQEIPCADWIINEAKSKTSCNPQVFDDLFITILCSNHFVKPLETQTMNLKESLVDCVARQSQNTQCLRKLETPRR